MKKIALILLALVLALSLTGCMGAGTAAETLPELPVPEIDWTEGTMPSPEKYADDLSGLCSFMEDGGAVIAGGDYPVEPAYDVIGALAGKRYRFTYNKSTSQMEFFEFDPQNLTEEAKALFDEAREKGTVTILRNTVPAVVSDGNRFLMIYIETKNDDANKTHAEMAKTYFAKFCSSKAG